MSVLLDRAGLTVTSLLAQPGGPDWDSPKGPEWGKAAPIGLLIILLLGIALYLLIRSMNKQLRKVPKEFGRPGRGRAAGTPGDGVGAGDGTTDGAPGDAAGDAAGGAAAEYRFGAASDLDRPADPASAREPGVGPSRTGSPAASDGADRPG
ncbi:hypothetical protein [Nakamurella leprariae]|uniref:Uncharacterized protein n=1 Tax=Nakamurella leprariae TaxID=2803911 RepID=A0A938YIV3_9ACTN|nr:hypothetical protein [Nakamurella leprariae]MBM9468590.1 hypothetical protein [Nakamurella leprariae]